MTAIKLCLVETYLPIEKLKIHPNNPRTIKPDRLQALKDSIVEKGFYQPILVWKKGNVILAGNHRFMAVQELIKEGFAFNSPDGEQKHVLPVVIEEVDDAVAEAILFETNNTYAEWVEEKLRLAIQDAEDEGRDIKGFGFTAEQVDNLLHNAIEDAERISDGEHPIDPLMVDEDALREAVGDEEFESLILPKPVYEKLTALLIEVAKGLSEEWAEGDSYAEATEALVSHVRETGVEAIWKAKSSLPEKSSSSSKKKPKTSPSRSEKH